MKQNHLPRVSTFHHGSSWRATPHLRCWALLMALTLALVLTTSPAQAQSVLVPAGSAWKYLDDGSNQGTAWREPGFNDASWLAGPAELGYGDGGEATVVSYGPNPSNKYVTTYFRHSFWVEDPGQYEVLSLRLLRDDGAVVYLNGVEACRSNMPAGPVTYLTLALTAVSGAAEHAFWESAVDAGVLVSGTNVLAAEIHQSSVTSSDISFDLTLASPGPFRKAPYLTFNGNGSEMEIRWQLRSTSTCAVEWGVDSLCADGSAVTSEYGSDHQHVYTVEGLAPSRRYFYRVIAGADTLAGSFRSAPDPGETDTAFLCYGDSRTYPAQHDQVASAMLACAAGDSSFHSIVLSVGDLVSDGDVEAHWDSELLGTDYSGIRTMLAGLPFQAAMGNHEESGLLFQKYFPYPFTSDRYWSFDYGPAHFAILDQYVDYGPGSAQLSWLETDLASTSKPWRFILLHEPGWSAGGGHANDVSVQDNLQPLCEEYGVAAVIAGHNHYYARALVNGVQHITTGGGGAPLYAPDTTYPYVVTAEMAYHYCTIQINANVLTFNAVTKDGAVIDEFTLLQTPTGTGTPSDVRSDGTQGLSPTFPNPFNASVNIDFTLPVAGKVSVRVYSCEGRLVRVLLDRSMAAGNHGVAWDGLDDKGRAVASGVYVCRLECKLGPDITRLEETRRIVLLR